MQRTFRHHFNASIFALIAFLSVMLSGGLAFAGEYTMQTNLNDVADQLARWSKQSGTGNLTPEAQMKLSELLLEASQVLKEMTMKGDRDMQMEHHKKIQMMKKAWNPFDTADRM